MKTKEEILENKFKELGIRKGWVDESKEAVLEAMEDYAAELMVNFNDKRNDEEIKRLKQELFDKYNITIDRDLINQLGISDEDKSKLFLWIRYQCAFSYREGYRDGQDEFKEHIEDLLKKV